MTNTCQACARKCDSGLCGECQRKLRAALQDLPTWLAALSDEHYGLTRKGDGGRGSSRREPFKGDDGALIRCACGHSAHPGCQCVCTDQITLERCLCDDYRPVADQAKIRAQFLGAGRVNARASDLFGEILNELGTTIRDLCETRGVEFTPVRSVEAGFIGPLLTGWRRLPRGYVATALDAAQWLAGAITAIAGSPNAGETFSTLCGLSGRIERLVDGPMPPRLVGPCPSSVDYGHDPDCKARHPHVCGNRLMARREAIEVTCRQCGRTHNVEYLVNRLINDAGHMRFTVAEIHQLVERLGEHLPVRTFQHWRKSHDGKPPRIKIAGYRSADGRRITISRHAPEDVPLYRLAEVRKAMDERKVKA